MLPNPLFKHDKCVICSQEVLEETHHSTHHINFHRDFQITTEMFTGTTKIYRFERSKSSLKCPLCHEDRGNQAFSSILGHIKKHKEVSTASATINAAKFKKPDPPESPPYDKLDRWDVRPPPYKKFKPVSYVRESQTSVAAAIAPEPEPTSTFVWPFSLPGPFFVQPTTPPRKKRKAMQATPERLDRFSFYLTRKKPVSPPQPIFDVQDDLNPFFQDDTQNMDFTGPYFAQEDVIMDFADDPTADLESHVGEPQLSEIQATTRHASLCALPAQSNPVLAQSVPQEIPVTCPDCGVEKYTREHLLDKENHTVKHPIRVSKNNVRMGKEGSCKLVLGRCHINLSFFCPCGEVFHSHSDASAHLLAISEGKFPEHKSWKQPGTKACLH
ncbi:hypothetical protein B0H11DRAFT_2076941 [Mycena galericulata]|nr:hypothetical protein B0H11DRAFT_2076941 [Mycena galericulata]